MPKKNIPMNDGYRPEVNRPTDVNKGYRPKPADIPSGNGTPHGGYSPTNTGDNPTNTQPPGDD